MASIELEAVLQGISPGSPCGENLEYDPDFMAMERAAQPRLERAAGEAGAQEEPDWKEVRARALRLLKRTLDVRVASHLARGLLATDGFPGFAEGVALICALMRRYWQDVHPQLDPSDGNDPTARVNSIRALADPETTLIRLRRTPLAASPTLGRVTLRDALAVRGQLQPLEGEPRPDASVIESVLDGAPADEVQATLEALTGALESISTLESFLLETIGPAQVPDLDDLTGLLRSGQGVLMEQLGRRTVGAAAPPPNPGEVNDRSRPGPSGAGVLGEIRSREDAVRALDSVIGYFEREEPSSPIPLLLRRAKGLVSKSFLEIIRDLAPDGARQVESIGGTNGEKK